MKISVLYTAVVAVHTVFQLVISKDIKLSSCDQQVYIVIGGNQLKWFAVEPHGSSAACADHVDIARICHM